MNKKLLATLVATMAVGTTAFAANRSKMFLKTAGLIIP